MNRIEKVPIYDFGTRLPIVFCIDVSPHMGKERHKEKSLIETVNETINTFIEILKDYPRGKSIEIAFLTYSTSINECTDFSLLRKIGKVHFSAVSAGSSRTEDAIIKSVDLIKRRIDLLGTVLCPHYPPVLIVITDDDMEDYYNRDEFKSIRNSINKYHIIPIFIEVGNEVLSENHKTNTIFSFEEYIRTPLKDLMSKEKIRYLIEFVMFPPIGALNEYDATIKK